MHIEVKKYPDIQRILSLAQGESKEQQCEVRGFFHPMTLTSNWDGGTKYWYTLIDMTNMKTLPLPESGNIGQPKSPELETLEENFCLVEKVIFCGKKMTPRIYFHPNNMPKYLDENKVELTEDEEAFFQQYRSLKSSYRPRNETIKASLIQKGLLAKNGAVTLTGKNYPTNEKYRFC